MTSSYIFPGITNGKLFDIIREIPIEEEQQLLKSIADLFHITKEDLIGTSRLQNIVYARHSAAYILRYKFNHTTRVVGEIINKSHPSITHSCYQFSILWETDKNFKKRINKLFFL